MLSKGVLSACLFNLIYG
ncbi:MULTISPECIES: hypothetical protein [Enterobacteriaceae]|nr:MULTISPECIES: hypothetical protein [Enterobacteriaceae]MDT1463104.1 protein YchT [Escherichia coli]MDZ9253308.1 protein YchT [Escherichia coli]MDZ9825961.1 protein YchT [Escherichia coli]MDZ9861219.1 protein YchT [Escherichia coli]MDZ9898534.1 protein YchT [Escherichia coli]